MASQFSMLGIFNAALLAQGSLEITQENDGSNEYRLLARNWPQIVESELEYGQYQFTREETTLVGRVAGKYNFTDGYSVPGDALHVRNVYILDDNGERCEVDWTQSATHVYLDNDDGCIIEYVICADPSVWSASFAMGIQKRCEALISRALKEEFTDADSLDDRADAFFDRARTVSSKSRSQRSAYKTGSIALARNRGRGTS